MPCSPRPGPGATSTLPGTPWPWSGTSRELLDRRLAGPSSPGVRWTPWSCAPTSIWAGSRTRRRPPQSPWAAKATESWRVSALLRRAAPSRRSSCTTGWSRLRPERVAAGTGRTAADAEIGDRTRPGGCCMRAAGIARRGRSCSRPTACSSRRNSSCACTVTCAAARMVLAPPDVPPRPAPVRIPDRAAGDAERAGEAGGRARRQGATEECARSAAGMQRGERLLYLAPAAVYLSEAKWRCGDRKRRRRAAAAGPRRGDRQGRTTTCSPPSPSSPMSWPAASTWS